MRQRGFSPVFILPIIAFLVIFVFLTIRQLKPRIIKILSTPTPVSSGSPIATSSGIINQTDWKTYTNTKYGFQMQYPKEFTIQENPQESTPSAPLALDKISFTDSNRNQFTVNIYPISSDPEVNTNVNNLEEGTGYCGSRLAQSTLTSNIFTDNGVTYKQVVRIDSKGRNLTDFCFFAPVGNLIVLRNDTGSTIIAMKRIISTFVFNTQSPGQSPAP